MSNTFLQNLVNLLNEKNVSDVHITSHLPMWVRRAGDMEVVSGEAGMANSVELLSWLKSIRYSNASVLEAIAARGGQDDFAANLGDIRIRIHCWVSVGALNVAVRKLATDIPKLESLGLPKGVSDLLSYPSGLILVVGATGSGKSTTLAACVDQLNMATKGHIITLEDPIEYVHHDKACRVRQRQISEQSDCVNFSSGVTAAMREDPDIIMVGEVRDQQTMQACLNAAQTGHLVLATLHTNSSVETIERVLAFYPEKERELARSVLAATLRGVIAQRLVKTMAGSRTLAAELMICNTAIRANIAQNQIVAIEQSMESGRSEGQVTMNYCLQCLYENGVISRDVALSSSNRRDILEKRIR